jgi:hypothetical protein
MNEEEQTNNHALSGIRIHERPSDVGLRLRPRGHWDRHAQPAELTALLVY